MDSNWRETGGKQNSNEIRPEIAYSGFIGTWPQHKCEMCVAYRSLVNLKIIKFT